MNDELIFADEDDILPENDHGSYKVLIVDDDEEVHLFTKLALKDFKYNSKTIEFISAYSGEEAKKTFQEHDDIAVTLLDVVMETNTAGLDVAAYVRKELKNEVVRIIIRTGQPGEAPERFVIDNYDINDYKEKTELTSDKLYTTLRTALSQYDYILDVLNKKDELYQLLVTDKLTGLPNRTMLNYDLDTKSEQSLMLIDLDRFSLINESYGFEIGDQVLIHISELLSRVIKQSMKLYRLEADIFAITIDDNSREILDEEVCAIKALLSNTPVELENISLHVSVTIGIVYYEYGNIIQKAEIALRKARRISPNRVEFYSNDLESLSEIEQNNLWTNRIAHAIENDNILTYFQPIIECATEKIVKYEALVRLEHDGEIYSPFKFLHVARQAGYLHAITRIVFEASCEKFQDNDYKFSINITDHDLADPEIVNTLEGIRKKYNIDTKRIVLELLEETSFSSNPTATENIKTLTSLGYGCSIDDFGTQCSNFEQLNTHTLESLKIDGKFIKDITTNKKSMTITESILFFTKKMDLPTVAEFVHSKEVYEKVKEYGITYAQGYYFGEPKPDLVQD